VTESEGDGQSWQPVPATAEALRELARLGEVSLGVELHAMARRVRAVVPELVGLSPGVVEDGVTLTLVSSVEHLAALDAVQYVDGGPCVVDVERAETLDVKVADLLDEDRWHLYAKASAAMGIASSLSMPIMADDRVIGGVNLYASTGDAFEQRHQEVAEAVGSDAAMAVTNADLSFRTLEVATEAPTRLRDGSDINIAVGLISASQDVSIPVARERLQRAAVRAGISEAQAARAFLHIRTT
jgi:GAF domain-containing protein